MPVTVVDPILLELRYGEDGDVLAYNAATRTWEPVVPTGGSGTGNSYFPSGW